VEIADDYTGDGLKADSRNRNPYVTLDHDPRRESGAWQYPEPKNSGPAAE
jgi:hypothetical protein